MKNDNTCLVIVMIVALVAIIAMVLIIQEGGANGALSAETFCYRNFYFCVEQTDTPAEDCLDIQVRCLEFGP